MDIIRTKEDFTKVVGKGIGYIVITDKSNPNRVHLDTCPHVCIENFTQKVLTNNGTNGAYFFTIHLKSAIVEHNAIECSVCRR